MPWILVKKKLKLIIGLATATLAIVIFAANGLFLVAAVILGLLFLFIISYSLNRIVLRRCDENLSVFTLDPTRPRNFDYLIIGEYCDVSGLIPDGTKSISFLAPGRSMEVSFLVLEHVFSLLKENGEVIFVVENEYCGSESLSLFDVTLLHPVAIRKLSLQNLKRKSRYPIIFSPLSSFKFLLSPKKKFMKKVVIDSKAIKTFCLERNISVTCYTF